MRRAARAVAAAFAVVVIGVTATGCGAIEAAIETEEALQREGFRDATVFWESIDGAEMVTVEWTARAETTEALEQESLQAAGVIWRVAPVYFDEVATLPDAPAVGDYDETVNRFARADLERVFGPRPAGLDQDIGELLNVRGLAVGVAVGLLVVTAVVAGIVVLVVRSGRKNRQPAYAGAYAPPGSWPPGSWPPGSWPPGQPGPPGSWPPGPPPGPPGSSWPRESWPPGSWPPAPPGPPPGPPPGAWPGEPTPDDPYGAPPR